jgi:DNA-binding NtrC family response regulator
VSTRHERPFVGISPDAMDILEAYHWPGNVRELRNLVESMVVLAPGREIGPDDIPTEVRSPMGEGAFLPVPSAPPKLPVATSREVGPRPELEFIFRTLVDLRVDMDELRREFEAYRRDRTRLGELVGRVSGPRPVRGSEVAVGEELADVEDVEVMSPVVVSEAPRPLEPGPPDSEPELEGVVVFRPGMTMEEVEREAIAAALKEVGGNRRKAAERLGIGERTLYRKIGKFGLE